MSQESHTTATSQSTTHSGESQTSDSHTSTSDHQTESKGESNPILEILETGMGDHHGFYLYDKKIISLPYIFYDKDQGLTFYSNADEVNASGIYQLLEGHPVRKDNHHQHPAIDFSITNFVFLQWMGFFVVGALFLIASSKAKKNKGKAPSGIQNLLEVLIVFIRDEVVSPNLPARPAKRLLPYFLSLFFFILILNIFGLMPGGHAATSALGTTIALALTAFIVVNYTAIKESGIGAWFHHLLGGAPAFLAPIMIPIEIMGIFTKPFALAIRLFANMTAGHVALLALVGIIFYFKELFGASVGYSVTVPSVLFSVFVLCLELLVAFLQAYVFTMLTAVFTGLAVGDHSHEEVHH